MDLRDTTNARIRQLRKEHGWTQQDLADVLNRFGAHTDRTAVARVETGKRELPLKEAFQYALALNVAPVHLFVPTDSDEPIQLGPTFECSPDEARAWIRGLMPMMSQDRRAYFSAVPDSEFDKTITWRVEEPNR
jgi:transcriptional regulator with XRE-family HTH domain